MPRPILKAFGPLVAACSLLLTGCPANIGRAAARTTAPPISVTGRAEVVYVVDGDTIDVRDGGHEFRVRLLGINTPESVAKDTPPMCFGHEASQRTAALLPVGAPVRLERDRELYDRYGRVLAYVYRQSDGLFINLDLVNGGFAEQLDIAPNHAHASEIAAAVAAAKSSGVGAWTSCPRPFDE